LSNFDWRFGDQLFFVGIGIASR